MIDYTQFGAQTQGQSPTESEDDVRKRRLAVQQPAGGTNAPSASPALPQPQQTDPRPTQGAPSPVASPASTPTFSQLQVAGIPRPAPPPLPVPSPVAPMAGQERSVDEGGGVTLSGSGVNTYIPAAQAAGFGGYDPTKPPPGYDPRAWALNNQDINQRQAHAYVTPDGKTQYGRSEGMGDSFGSGQEFEQYLAGLPPEQRQQAMFSNPRAYQMLQGGSAGATGGPNMQQAGMVDPTGSTTSSARPDLLNQLTAPAGGGGGAGGGGPLGDDIMSVLRNLLQSPTAYGSDAMQREYEAGGRQIDDDFKHQNELLTEEMARRGLYDSSIAGGRMSDLNVGKRSAQTELMDRLLMKRADSQDSGIRSALQAAMGYDSDTASRGLDRERFGEGQRQFDQSLGFDKERYQGDQDRWNQQFLATLWELFGGTQFGL